MSTATTAPATIGNVFEDSLEVLWAPGTVFERAKSRGFGKYLLVLTLISLVITIIAAKLIGPWIDASFDLQMQLAASRGQAVPENAMAAARKFGSIGFYASPLFIVVLGSFVGGLLLMLAGKIVSAPISYGQGVLVAALGSVPRILSVLVSAIFALVSDAESARSMYDLSVGPARFLDPHKISPVLLQLLGGLDVFNLWQLVIFGVGVSVLGRVSRSTGFIAALVAWVLGTALPLLPTLLAS